jgi:hypothetical protein
LAQDKKEPSKRGKNWHKTKKSQARAETSRGPRQDEPERQRPKTKIGEGFALLRASTRQKRAEQEPRRAKTQEPKQNNPETFGFKFRFG